MLERLQKVLANHQVASRRKCEALILEGRVKVNGNIVTELGTKVSASDYIEVDEKKIIKQAYTYILMNKPRGIISSVSDDKGRKTVFDLLNLEDQEARLYPVGRLDYDTAGILLMTNDGAFMQKMTHPKHQIDKVYRVVCQGIITRDAVKKLKTGVSIGGNHIVKGVDVHVLERRIPMKTSYVEIVLIDGKYHQVKEMFAAVGFPAIKLTRVKYAFLNLEGVKRGFYRYLKVHEVKKLFGYQFKHR
ncbi:MAG TPA: pseudouridine synthase [Acholeplasmataceae bacterium]|nr:pseudouridine synthase [Acholeplasmataceae bacterium]